MCEERVLIFTYTGKVCCSSAFLFFGVFFPDGTGVVFDNVQIFIVGNFGWFYMLPVAIFIGGHFIIFRSSLFLLTSDMLP